MTRTSLRPTFTVAGACTSATSDGVEVHEFVGLPNSSSKSAIATDGFIVEERAAYANGCKQTADSSETPRSRMASAGSTTLHDPVNDVIPARLAEHSAVARRFSRLEIGQQVDLRESEVAPAGAALIST